MFKVGDLFFTELGRLQSVVIAKNLEDRIDEIMKLTDKSRLLENVTELPEFEYHLETGFPLIKHSPDPEDDNRKIIIKYLGNGEFEEILTHEILTLETYRVDDPIWEKLGINDNEKKRINYIVYDNMQLFKEQIDYFKKNPLRLWIEDGLNDIKPIDQLNEEEYKSYSDELRIEKIKRAKAKALIELEDSIDEMFLNDYDEALKENCNEHKTK